MTTFSPSGRLTLIGLLALNQSEHNASYRTDVQQGALLSPLRSALAKASSRLLWRLGQWRVLMTRPPPCLEACVGYILGTFAPANHGKLRQTTSSYRALA